MKKIFCLFLVLSGVYARASEVILLEDQKSFDIDLNQKTVRCSRFGYGLSELKISIPGLSGWTVLDHTNRRFGDLFDDPCMSAGECTEGRTVATITQGVDSSEQIVVDRKLIERMSLVNQVERQLCQRVLREELHAIVKGIPFFHSREILAEQLPERACR